MDTNSEKIAEIKNNILKWIKGFGKKGTGNIDIYSNYTDNRNNRVCKPEYNYG